MSIRKRLWLMVALCCIQVAGAGAFFAYEQERLAELSVRQRRVAALREDVFTMSSLTGDYLSNTTRRALEQLGLVLDRLEGDLEALEREMSDPTLALIRANLSSGTKLYQALSRSHTPGGLPDFSRIYLNRLIILAQTMDSAAADLAGRTRAAFTRSLQVQNSLGLAMVVGLGLGICAAAVVLARIISASVKRLSAQVDKLPSSDPTRCAPGADESDELTAVAGALAAKLADLQASWVPRRQAEDVRRRLDLMAVAVEHLGEMVLVTDGGFVLEYANPAFCRAVGLAADQLPGRAFPEFVAEGGQALLARPAARHEVRREHLVCTGTDGRRFPAECTLTGLYSDSGGMAGQVLVVRDLTERIALEDKARRNEKMQALGLLAGGVAHDFNNLLTVVMGMSELELDQAPADSSLAASLREILAAAGSGRDLVAQILAYSRARGESSSPPVDARPVLKESLRLAAAMAAERVELVAAVDPSPLPVRIDPAKLQALVLNLAKNAVDAMGEAGGRLALKASRQSTEQAEVLRLVVEDSGPGIDAQHLERIFDPYFTTKNRGLGTGLGLSMVRATAMAGGGSAWAGNRERGGARLVVELPLAEHQAPGDEQLTPALPRFDGVRVLVVDDDASVLGMSTRLLASLGCDAQAAETAVLALKRLGFEDHGFDAVLTDQVMPGMTGLQLARRIALLDPGLPVILCSGFHQQEASDGFERAAIAAFLPKPYSRAELAEALGAALGRGRQA